MERLKKTSFHKPVSMDTETVSKVSTMVKWIPLICAGAAVGVSMVALNEIKNIRKELVNVKSERFEPVNDELSKRMGNMEIQLKSLSDFIKNKQLPKPKQGVVKNVVKQEQPEIKIINDEEYEEVEVTDDEAEEN